MVHSVWDFCKKYYLMRYVNILAPEHGLIKQKLSALKFIFTIFSVVELKIIGATFASLKRPAISASLDCLPFICCSMHGFQIFPNDGQIWFFLLQDNHTSLTKKCPGNIFVSL
jgi:hypothetical protein